MPAKNQYEFIGRTLQNYGVQGYVGALKTKPNKAGQISVSQIGSIHAQLRSNDWYASQNMFQIIPRNNFELANLFMVATINRALRQFGGYSNYPTLEKLNDLYIKIPITKEGHPNLASMNQIVAELEAQRVAELEAYLTASGLKDYELDEDDYRVLEDYRLTHFESFKVTDIFDVRNTRNILSSEITPGSGSTPYLCASALNNSVSSYITYRDELIESGQCIFIGGKTFVVTYQEQDFFSNDSHNLALYPKIAETRMEKELFLGLCACVYKSLSYKYSWGDSVSKTKINRDIIFLPSKDGVPDNYLISRIIKVVQKMVISSVVKYTDNKIEATRKVVG